MALWPSIMACSLCTVITVPLNRGHRPLVWPARVIVGREPDSAQIAFTQNGGRGEINQRDERRLERTTKMCWEDEEVRGKGEKGNEGLKGKLRKRYPLEA